MAHLTARGAYDDLAVRFNRFPQGAPPTELLFRILKMLFTEREATSVALLPIRPFTAAAAARIWKTTEAEALKDLETLAGRGRLVDRGAAMSFTCRPRRSWSTPCWKWPRSAPGIT